MQPPPQQLPAQQINPSVPLGDRNKLVRRNPSILGAIPSRKQLEPLQLSVTKIDEGLKVGEEFATLDSPGNIQVVEGHLGSPYPQCGELYACIRPGPSGDGGKRTTGFFRPIARPIRWGGNASADPCPILEAGLCQIRAPGARSRAARTMKRGP